MSSSLAWTVDAMPAMAISQPAAKPRAVRSAPRLLGPIRARYDAASPDVHNERHWAMADALSARAANSPGVRETLRNRARYEVANNCYARGIVNTLADVSIGCGPTINMPRGGVVSREQNETLQMVERLFEEWAIETSLWQKVWTMRVARAQDGEGCAVLRTNERLESPVQLDVQVIEAEQLTHGLWADGLNLNEVDGIEVDDYGNPLRYHVLRTHPNDAVLDVQRPVVVQPSAFLHWYRVERGGQLRGVPEIMPALPLFAQLRRYTLATLTAAESAADVAAVITSNIVPEYDVDGEDEPLNYHDIHRGMFMELPDGRDINQLKPEQPTTTYGEFKRELLCEIARCLQMPKAFALGDFSDSNYASGRLDRQQFDRNMEKDRFDCETAILRKVWRAWWYEAARIPGYLPAGAVELVEGRRPRWLWRELGHVDRVKEESGIEIALRLGTTTVAEECGRRGVWWEDNYEQRGVEIARARELGITPEATAAPAKPTARTEDQTEDEDEEVDEDEQAEAVND